MSSRISGGASDALLVAVRSRGGARAHAFNSATTAAVKAWQKHLGLPRTGIVDFGRVTFAAHPIRVESLKATTGEALNPGQAVLAVTDTSLRISLTTDAANAHYLTVGKGVAVTLPDGTETKGTLTAVGTVAKPEPGASPDGDGGKPTISAEVTVTAPGTLAKYAGAAADVALEVARRPNVLAVPVSALLAQRGGGYAVAVIAGDGTRRMVPVTLGLFVDDQVEVSGPGLTADTEVEVPSA